MDKAYTQFVRNSTQSYTKQNHETDYKPNPQSELAAFCLYKCPHDDCPEGICKEFRRFRKQWLKEHPDVLQKLRDKNKSNRT